MEEMRAGGGKRRDERREGLEGGREEEERGEGMRKGGRDG